MFKSVDECMSSSNNDITNKANSMGIKNVILDTQENKLKVCKSVSSHQQQFFVKNKVNKTLTKVLKKQEEECDSLCK